MANKVYKLSDAPIPQADKDYLKDYICGNALIVSRGNDTVGRVWYDEYMQALELGNEKYSLTGRIVYPYPEDKPRVIYAEAYNSEHQQRVFLPINMDCRYYGFNEHIKCAPVLSYEVHNGNKAGSVYVPEWFEQESVEDTFDISDMLNPGVMARMPTAGLDGLADTASEVKDAAVSAVEEVKNAAPEAGSDDGKKKKIIIGAVAAIVIAWIILK